MTFQTEELKKYIKSSEKSNRLKVMLLVSPLALFLLFFFVFPILMMLYKSVYNPYTNQYIPQTSVLLQEWDPQTGLPNENLYETFGKELLKNQEEKSISKLGAEIGRFGPRMSSLIKKTGRKLARIENIENYKQAFSEINERWVEKSTFVIIKSASNIWTPDYYLHSLDLTRNENGNVVFKEKENQIYVDILLRTLFISFTVTLATFFLGYPLAFYLSTLPTNKSNLLFIFVLLPFWTSLLVRTTSWIVLLQGKGVLNDMFLYLKLIEEPLDMMYNQFSVTVGMTHILLPFMILPLFSNMKSIDPIYMKASRSLGANGLLSFIKIYFPMTLPGIGAGIVLVFIMAVGYYITPALLGGSSGQMISNLIAFHMQSTNNWGLAAALGSILLLVILFLYWVYDKLVGVTNFKLG